MLWEGGGGRVSVGVRFSCCRGQCITDFHVLGGGQCISEIFMLERSVYQ